MGVFAAKGVYTNVELKRIMLELYNYNNYADYPLTDPSYIIVDDYAFSCDFRDVKYSVYQDADAVSKYVEVNYNSAISAEENGAVLRSAIASAPDGATVLVDAGTYAFDTALTMDKSVSLIGDGVDKTILETSTEMMDFILVAGGGNDFKMSGVSVKGVDNNTHNNSSAVMVGTNDTPNAGGSVVIENCEFTNFTKNGITIKGGQATISGNVIDMKPFTGSASNAIQIDQGAEAVITGNTIIGTGVSTSESWSSCGVGVYRDGKANTISGNIFRNCQIAVCLETAYDDADDATSIDENAEANNTFENCAANVEKHV